MRLTSVASVSLRRITEDPINPDFPEETRWPAMINAVVTLTVNDGIRPDDLGEYPLEILTRLIMTDASEPLPAVETRALRQLASQLRVLADALSASPSVGTKPTP